MSRLVRTLVMFACVLSIGAQAWAQEQTFAGLKFGMGLSTTVDTGTNERVDEAVIDTAGLVRITKKGNAIARVMLETHYFWTPRSRLGVGPFLAVQPGSDEIINALGAGVMFGVRRADTSQSFNLGVGFVLDPSVRVLGPGFQENAAPPRGETEIRYQTRDQGGLLLLSSFSW